MDMYSTAMRKFHFSSFALLFFLENTRPVNHTQTFLTEGKRGRKSSLKCRLGKEWKNGYIIVLYMTPNVSQHYLFSGMLVNFSLRFVSESEARKPSVGKKSRLQVVLLLKVLSLRQLSELVD